MKKNSIKNCLLLSYYTFFVSLFLPFSAFSLDCEDKYYCGNKITMFGGKSKLGDFEALPYVNQDAPKGGEVTYASIGTFDSLNSFVLKGVPASGIGMIYDSLTSSTLDEVFTRRGLVAEKIYMARDNSHIIFDINPEAKWHDGKNITADDVVFTFNKLIEEGNPFYKSYFADVEEVVNISESGQNNRVKFVFKRNDNRELPFIVGEMPIIPKHYWENKDFSKSTLEPPLGSGAYKITEVDSGRSISYERVDNYWAKDLPINKGRYNFDKITYDYYRDATVAVEAFKAGEYDIRQENIAKNWANLYDIDKVKNGEIIKEEIPHSLPTGMQAFILNLRRDKFKDQKVRRALSLAFDFEWTNKTLFHSSYSRTRSYFSNTIYEAKGLPEGKELEILEQFRGEVPESVFLEEYNPPKTNGDGNNRQNLIAAKKLLEQAGWKVIEGVLKNSSGESFDIEFLISSNSFERVIQPYISNLKRLGIKANIRLVDPAQYIKRNDDFDFDVVVRSFGSGLIPGNELKNYWHSEVANVKGSGNLSGVENKVVDQLVEKIITSETTDDLIASTKALDRVLQHNNYVIPHWNIQKFRILYKNKFGKPEISPKYGLAIDSWWIK
jgi:microcin C transport system substrate-binding protein